MNIFNVLKGEISSFCNIAKIETVLNYKAKKNT